MQVEMQGTRSSPALGFDVLTYSEMVAATATVRSSSETAADCTDEARTSTQTLGT